MYRLQILDILMLFILVMMMKFVNCDVCITDDHIMKDYKRIVQGNELKSLSATFKNTFYYRTLEIHYESNQIIVGSKNYVYFLNDTSLEVLHTMNWESEDDYESCLSETRLPKSYCGNYIQFLKLHKNKLLICGSNSLQPKYRIIDINTYETLDEKVSFDICSSPDPNFKVVGQITNAGEVITGEFKAAGGKKPEFSGIYLLEKPVISRVRLTSSSNQYKISKPEFTESFYIEDAVYVFFMENAEELGDQRLSTVARLCDTDNGGSSLIITNMWTTLRKTRLSCKYKGEKDNVEFKELADVTYDPSKKLFYAAYTLSRDQGMISTICTFDLEDIKNSMQSNFLVEDTEKKNTWKEISNGNFLINGGCQVNAANVSFRFPHDEKKQPTNSLSIKSLAIALRNSLVAKQVYSKNDIFQFMKVAKKFTKVIEMNIVTSEDRKRKSQSSVLYIATEIGEVYLIYNQNGRPCIVEELQTKLKMPKTFTMNKKKDLLYLTSDEQIIAMSPYSCHQHTSQRECVEMHNPVCGWSVSLGKCIPWNKVEKDDEWLQDLTVCPKRKEYLSQWSLWEPLQQTDEEKYCLYRQRECQSCNKSLCSLPATVQIKNCSDNKITDVSSWLKHGSIDGNWSPWSNWSECHQSRCGNITVSRERLCNSPSPSNGGKKCFGDSFECRSCNREEDKCQTIWGSWTNWGECLRIDEEVYFQYRNRSCSRLNQCSEGETYERRKCAPKGIIWGNWTKCNCVQMVKHRYPVFINGCDSCPALDVAYYTTCEEGECPKIEVPDTKEIETKNVTEKNNIENDTKTEEESIKEQIKTNIINSAQKQKFKEARDGYRITLKELIIACCGIFVTCFLICTLIIVLILKHKQKQYIIPGNKQSEKNKFSRDLFNNGNSSGRDSQRKQLIPREPTENGVPLVDWNGTPEKA